MGSTKALWIVSVMLAAQGFVGASDDTTPRNRAFSVAANVLDDMVLEGMSGWTRESKLANAFPVYIEGVGGVSYYEVKVVTGGRSSGYILVNVNGADIEVPEITMNGVTTTERFRGQLGRDDLKVVRYDWFASGAKSADKEALLAVIGFDGTEQVRRVSTDDWSATVLAFDARYRELASSQKCVPYEDRASLDEYYTELSAASAASGPERPLDTYYRNYLKGIFRCDGGQPVAGDFNRDGRADDVATFNPAAEVWDYDFSGNGTGDDSVDRGWGEPGDMPVGGDFDRDGRIDDVALFRPADRQWYFDNDHDGDTDGAVITWGAMGDAPIAGDFDRDGFCDDVGVYRSSTMMWYYDFDHDGDTDAGPIGTWGISGDRPVAGDFDRDGYKDDVALFRPGTRRWYFDYDHNDTTNATLTWATATDQPIAGDFDRDGFGDDIGVFRPTDGTWYYNLNYSGDTDRTAGPWGPAGQCWHTPSWDQPGSTDGYPVGCGNTAWAMIYAYWRHFKSKTALFDRLDLTGRGRSTGCDSGTIYTMMWHLADLNETVWGGSDDDKWGMTYPWKMSQGIDYAHEKGYAAANVVRWRGDEREKFNDIEREIRDYDRPVILYISADEGVHFGDHYVGIEGTVKIDRGWRSTAIGYLVNYGWGEFASVTLKWIFTRPTTYDPHHSVYDAYLVRF